MRPWHERANELKPKEGDYCDYVAFLEWFDEKLESGPWPDLRDTIETAEPNWMIPIYSLICDAFDTEQIQRLEAENAKLRAERVHGSRKHLCGREARKIWSCPHCGECASDELTRILPAQTQG